MCGEFCGRKWGLRALPPEHRPGRDAENSCKGQELAHDDFPFSLAQYLVVVALKDQMELPAVLNFLLTRETGVMARYYRVEVAYNLFGEYSVVREWGARGRRGQHLLVWFSNLREACVAAEQWRRRAMRRRYDMEGSSG